MIGRAVTAFRKSVIKSKSSTALVDSTEENESIVSDDSLSINVESHRRVLKSSKLSTGFLRQKRQRRSQSVNREGEYVTVSQIVFFSNNFVKILYCNTDVKYVVYSDINNENILWNGTKCNNLK